MWKINNNFVFTLLIVLSGLLFFYQLFQSFSGTALLFLLVIVGYFILTINNIDPATLQEIIPQLFTNIYKLLNLISINYLSKLFEIIKVFYQCNILEKMERYRRRGTYQLSSDYCETPQTGLSRTVKELSPIPREKYSTNLLTFGDGKSLDKITSTPRWESRVNRKHDYDNNVSISDHILMRKSPSSSSSSSSSSLYLSNLNASKMSEANSGSFRSPWGVSISPQMRPRAMGVQSVQTVAGPLLASTRYNIDPKTYADVRSPGLTSRLTKYATEANTKLIYQPQYRAGQFPKINLNANPLPIVNPKSGCMNVTPVKVKIAQPETSFTSPDKKKMHQKEKYAKKSSNNVQVFREITLKRPASTDEISEFIKKQRTDIEISSFEEDKNYDEEEITQKRGRDESSRSEDDISIDNSSRRPFKKTKKPSCYDVLSSLSSSSNMICGVKRKADVSRCDTPEMGKPYKTLKNSARESLSPSMIIEIPKANESLNKSLEDKAEDISQGNLSPKLSRKYLPENDIQSQSSVEIEKSPMQVSQETLVNEKKKDTTPVNFSEKLFMKEEPENVDKFKSLIEEQGDMKAKFSTSTDEIIKEDVIATRQTSMKAKLQSMFDAISGKVSSKIDSSVVIRADKADPPTPSSDVSSITTLTSQTSTTTVNSAPILTTVVSPIIGKSKDPLAPAKHVTFALPSSSSSSSSSAPSLNSSLSSEMNNSLQTTKETSLPVVGKTEVPTQQTSTLSSSVPSFNFSASVTKPSVITVPSSKTEAVGTTTTTTTATASFSLSNFGKNSGTTQGFSLSPGTSLKETPSTTSSVSPPTTQTISFSSIQKPTTGFTQPTNSTNLFSSENKPSMFNTPVSANSTPQQSQFSFGTTNSLAKSTESLVSTGSSSSATPVVSSNNVLSEFLVFGAPTTSTTTSSFATVPSATTTTTSSNTFTPVAATTTAAPSFSFGTSSSSSGVSKVFSFGAQNTTQSVTSAPSTLSFASAPSVSLKSGFQAPVTSTQGFGITAPTSSVSSTPSFGIGTTTSTAGFGINSPSFTMPSGTSASLFSTPTTTTSSSTANSTQQSSSIFSTTNTQKNLPSLFSATPTTTASSGNIFSTNSTNPSFGAAPTTTTASTNLFNTQTNSVATNSIFGTSGNAVDQTKQAPPPAFGATTTTTSSSAFGSNTTNNFGNNNSGSLFTSGSTTNNVFGKQNSDGKLPAFGDLNSSGGTFKPAPSVFGSGTSLLNGSGNNAPSFGANNTTASSFFQGTTSSGFTNKNQTTSTGFGTPAQQQQQPPPPFPGSTTSFSGLGTTPANTNSTAAAPPAFGAQNFSTTNTSNNTTTPFAFGATQTATSQPQGQTGIFGFSGSAPSSTDKPASGTTSLFQFGAAPTTQSGQFNFSANTPALPGAPPAFGAATGTGTGAGGMFSIGSGSTAPRSRPARPGRRQR